MSLLRRQESIKGKPYFLLWIPAFAGMTSIKKDCQSKCRNDKLGRGTTSK